MQRRDDGLLDGIEDERATATPAGLIAAVILFELAVLVAIVLLQLGMS